MLPRTFRWLITLSALLLISGCGDEPSPSAEDQEATQAAERSSAELAAYKDASKTDTKEAWEAYLSEHRGVDSTRTVYADQAVKHHKYSTLFEFENVKMTRIAVEAPHGDERWPNGWKFSVKIRNISDKTVSELKLNVIFYNDEGEILHVLGSGKPGIPYVRHLAVWNPSAESSDSLRKELSFREKNPLDSWKPLRRPLVPTRTVRWSDFTRAVPPNWNGDFKIRIRDITVEGED
jgi:hypothetical protein